MKLAEFVFGTIPLLVQLYANKFLGGGTAGCVVAGRLSQKYNVLLLESGGTPVPQADVPYFTKAVNHDLNINYVYNTVPQKNFFLKTAGVGKVDTGKMLGGSGSHNGMGHQRGSPWDYDNYAKITNDSSWTYMNVLPFFKKSEKFVGTLFNPSQAGFYGRDGPLTVDTHLPEILPRWFAAGIDLGFKIDDPNAFQVESFAPFEKLIEKGHRVSTYTGYVKPFEGIRQNLTVIRYAEVSEVLIDKFNQAYGVSYLRHGIAQIAHASKEVIVSAGAINSPLILMKSGVGPQALLKEAEIPVKVNLPGVGENLSDHIDVHIPSFTFNSTASKYLPRIPEDELESILTKYLKSGSGEFGQMQNSAQAFYVSSRAKREEQGHWPDVGISMDAMCDMPLDDEQALNSCFMAILNRPKSKGRVTLNATAYKEKVNDYSKLALIDLNVFAEPSDLDVLVEGIGLIFRVVKSTPAFKSLGAKYSGVPEEGCSRFQFRSVAYWKCYVKRLGTAGLHFSGTCSMGNGPLAVTDSKFRVRGIGQLRVVDASVLPELPNSNINGPVILVAEKAADVILKSW